MILALVFVPLGGALLALLLRGHGLRRALWVAVAAAHFALVLASWFWTPAPAWNDWLAIDPPGHVFLSIASALFFAATAYGVGYLRREGEHEKKRDIETLQIFSNAPEAVFVACMLAFVAAMTVVCLSQHFGILWVAVEATTLVTAPLIYFHRHARSLEATWKYLLVCSVGIALALLGNLFLGVAGAREGEPHIPLVLGDLIAAGPRLHVQWLHASFVLLLVGYGTKMGLAPLHTWLPDAHSESPSIVSALLSGALLNCAFLGILRGAQVCQAAGQGAVAQDLLIALGLGSMALAAAFIIGQADYKRMLAYSSVEHMGILALGVGLGGAGVFGSVLHAVNHSAVKAMLFFLSGNILAIYRTKDVQSVTGLVRVAPWTGALWMVGLLAITGSPPFGMFVSELIIVRAAAEQQRWWIVVAFLALLAVIFVGMATAMVRMAQGPAPEAGPHRRPELASEIGAPLVFAVVALVLGLWLPPPIAGALHEVARALGGS